MAIFGIGVDLVDVARIADAIDRGGAPFTDRIFTKAEQAYCVAQYQPSQHFAARFAAKEAVMKALGQGFGEGSEFNEIEITRPDAGRPSVQLHGTTAANAARLRISRIHLSLSHTATAATAYAIAEVR